MKELRFVIDHTNGYDVLGIYGDKEKSEKFYNRAYSYGITNGNLYWISDNFCYFFTTREKLRKGFFAEQISALRNMKNRVKGIGNLRSYIENKVENKMAAIGKESFYRQLFLHNDEAYNSGVSHD